MRSLELHVLREMLMHKFGREFSINVMENKDGCVNERVRLHGVDHSVSILITYGYF